MKQADIIIVGAGAAGLMAARELTKHNLNIIILEASDHVGGRIKTIQDAGFSQPVEAGAEFVHGKLPFTMQLLKEAEINYTPAEGDIFRHKDGKLEKQEDFMVDNEALIKQLKELAHDMTVDDFLNKYFSEQRYAEMRESVTRFIEGYEAADTSRASVLAMRGDLEEDEPEQYRIDGGYAQLIKYLEQQCYNAGCTIQFSSQVKEVHWSENNVKVKTATDSYEAKKILLTVPIGILQEDVNSESAIKFHPAVSEKIQAAKALGKGNVVKVLLEFRTAFWREPEIQQRGGVNLTNMSFLFSDEPIPTWWTQLPVKNNLLTGWLGGPQVQKYQDADESAILNDALKSLATIFKLDEAELTRRLKAWHIANWQKDVFTRCAYTYAAVESEKAKKELNRPVKNTIYFAGEAVYSGNATGTTEAALASAVNVVKEMLNS